MSEEQLIKVFTSRPFKTRNADEYELDNILDLFVDPTEGLIGPFDFTNSIVKGKMGTGKTMLLRANYAYYIYTLVPSLMENTPIILPVYIKLSDFQNLRSPEEIYDAIIIKIIEEMLAVRDTLKSAGEMARLHTGVQKLPGLWSTEKNEMAILEELKKLTAEEYVENIRKNISEKGSATWKFFEASIKCETESLSQIKQKKKPSFQNIIDAYEQLIKPFGGKILILFDEIGSTSRDFFKDKDGNESYFKILMNQLRTLSFVRTKIAVYPHSYSDILNETRYGDTIELECDLSNDNLYDSFISKTVSLIERYIEESAKIKLNIEEVYDITSDEQQIIEQIINGTKGNMRRMVHLLDLSMDAAFRRANGKDKVRYSDLEESLNKQGAEMESKLLENDKLFLSKLVKLCKSRSTYRFTFSNRTTYINKFTSYSSEYNIINICQAGAGRLKTVYEFDYAYCIYKDIPTHYIKGTEKIDKTRSRRNGTLIKRIAQLSDELIAQSDIVGKIIAEVTYIGERGNNGFAITDSGEEYFISTKDIIGNNQNQKFRMGQRVQFFPAPLGETVKMGMDIELLN